MDRLPSPIRPMLPLFFRAYDALVELLTRRSVLVRRALLVIAFGSVFFVAIPGFRRDFGSFSESVLILILFVSPVASYTRMRLALIVLGMRRELGILMACLAAVHVAGYLLDRGFSDIAILPYLAAGDILGIDNRLLLGFLAAILVLPLFATSNRRSLSWLGVVRWKRLHRLVYPLFVFVILHHFLMGANDTVETVFAAVQTALLLGGYAALKYLAWKPDTIPVLRMVVDLIDREYVGWKSALEPSASSIA